MSYQEPFREYQDKWLKRLSDLVGAEEGREMYVLFTERNFAREALEKNKKIIKEFLRLYDLGNSRNEKDFKKGLDDLRSIAN